MKSSLSRVIHSSHLFNLAAFSGGCRLRHAARSSDKSPSPVMDRTLQLRDGKIKPLDRFSSLLGTLIFINGKSQLKLIKTHSLLIFFPYCPLLGASIMDNVLPVGVFAKICQFWQHFGTWITQDLYRGSRKAPFLSSWWVHFSAGLP